MRRILRLVSVALSGGLLLAACGGGGGGSGGGIALVPPGSAGTGGTQVKDYVIGGTVTGIAAGGEIVLKNNEGDPLTVSANGQFTFKQRSSEGASYSVSVLSAPPAQACTVVFSSGVVGAFDITSVKVLCGPAEQAAFHTAAAMRVPRADHKLVGLPDGSLLALGGRDLSGGGVTEVERYDPLANLWTPAGTLPFQVLQAAVLLPSSGKVLVAGAGAQPQIYDPATQTFVATGAFVTLTNVQHLVVLLDGRVLASDGNRVELYRPDAGVWKASATAAIDHSGGGSFTLLANGKILASGGLSAGATFADSEIFDASLEKWTAAKPLAIPRQGHRSVLLPTGKVLVVGGSTGSIAHACACGLQSVANAELFDPITSTWSSAGSLTTSRDGFSATLMPTGVVLVVGGNLQSRVDSQPGGGFRRTIPTSLGSVEAYDPKTNAWQPWGPLQSARSGHSASLMSSGKLLVTGGLAATSDDPATRDAYMWHYEWVTRSEVGW